MIELYIELWGDGTSSAGIALEPDLSDLFLDGGEIIARGGMEAVRCPDRALRIAIIGSATTDYLSRVVAVACLREGRLPVIEQAPFGAYVQELLDPGSAFYRFKPEVVVLVTEWRDCVSQDLPLTATVDEAAKIIGQTAARFERCWALIEARTDARIIQHLAAPPPFALTGIAERRLAASPASQLEFLNRNLLERGAGRVAFIDMARIAAERGAREVSTLSAWYTAKLPFNIDHLPAYLPPFRAALRTVLNRSKKVLVLDLDNTLWGGVIGDDGVDGLNLGPGEPAGEAFQEFQSYVRELARRGVILAVCSKNDPAIAVAGFKHPFSHLKRSDFAAFECSWTDKANGLRRVAETLNVGIDSMVFADDNPAECDLVRRELPEVAVVHLGEDPSHFIDKVEAGYWFEFQSFSAEDFARAEAYQARAVALAARDDATDLDSYLSYLEMTARFFTPGDGEIKRVAQLESKTNQFNLTTRRYTETAIRTLLARVDAAVWAFSLADRFGDHGLVSVLIAIVEGEALRIDEWLMSCRVFSRTAEQAMLRAVLEFAAVRGIGSLKGEYRPTEKNAVVSDLYARLGFSDSGDGFWSRPVEIGMEDLVTHIRLD